MLNIAYVVKLEDTEERTERPKRKSYAARGDRIFDCLLCKLAWLSHTVQFSMKYIWTFSVI